MKLLNSEDRTSILGYLEDIPSEDLENRATALAFLETIKSDLKEAVSLSEDDIKFLRSINIRLRDVVDRLVRKNHQKDRPLINRISKIINDIEQYIQFFYDKMGYLPDYTYDDYAYFRRRSEDYGYPYYRYYPYYHLNYPNKKREVFEYLDKETGKFELKESVKDAIFAEVSSKEYYPKSIWNRPTESFEDFITYNIRKLKEYTEDLRRQNLSKEQQLSNNKPEYEQILSKILDKWLKMEKESGRW